MARHLQRQRLDQDILRLHDNLGGGWNTVSVNFTDSRLGDPAYSSNTVYDYTKVTGLNIAVGTKNADFGGQTYVFKLDFLDINLN